MDLDPVPYFTIEQQVNARRLQNFAFKHPILNIIPTLCRCFQEVSGNVALVNFDEFFRTGFLGTVLPFKMVDSDQNPILYNVRDKTKTFYCNKSKVFPSVADPDPRSGIRCLFDPGYGKGFSGSRISDSGS
jgi:hypothetical protein